jgi:succinate dehydrogenase / fumarate reductase cytochrome b subunit
MAHVYDKLRPGFAALRTTSTAQEIKNEIVAGSVSDERHLPDLAASPRRTGKLATDTPNAADRVAPAMRQKLLDGSISDLSGLAAAEGKRRSTPAARPRPRSPNIQIYRPQITSVLSILNRMSGIVLSAFAVLLVVWLIAAAIGPQTYGVVQGVITSWIGQIVLFGATFVFFLHLCGGIRHLVWDTVHGFELRSIYISGWAVVASSVVLTLAVWIVSLLLKG